MKHLLAVVLWVCTAANGAPVWGQDPRVAMDTNFGTFVIELFPEQAPATVENFLRYIDERCYDDTLFHALIPDVTANKEIA